MKKFFNWLFGFDVKPESKEDQDKRVAQINSTLNELQGINKEIAKKEREIEIINKYLKQSSLPNTPSPAPFAAKS